MAKTGQKAKSAAKKRSPKTKAGAGKTVKVEQPQGGADKTVKTEPQQAGAGKMVKAELLQALKQEVSENSKALAKALMRKAVAGNSSSASILLKALDDQIKQEANSAEQEPEGQAPTLAEQLAKEESWGKLENGAPERISKPERATET
jgi:hypothetical protein